MLKRTLSLLPCLLLACATSQHAAKNTAPAQPPLAVQVVAGRGGQSLHAVRPGSQLRDGEQLRVAVQVQKPAYLYVVHMPADGVPTLLHPRGKETVLQPGQLLSVPEGDKGLDIQGDMGNEHVYVISSQKPLLYVDQDLCNRFSLPCKAVPLGTLVAAAGPGAAAVARRDAPPPQPVSFPVSGTEGVLNVDLDKRGVGFIELTYEHVP